jgi:para-nitrobenzyl esterase
MTFGGGSAAEVTAKSFAETAHHDFGDRADAFLSLYPARRDDEARQSHIAYAGDRVILRATWALAEAHAKTSHAQVFRYIFDEAPPAPEGAVHRGTGAYHSAEIVYAFDTLDSKPWPWTAHDRHVADAMSSYWVNFARTGDPNGAGQPEWPEYMDAPKGQVLEFGSAVAAKPEPNRARYEFLQHGTLP